MDVIQLKLTGADELARKLRELPGKLEKKALQLSALEAMREVLPDIQDAVPQSIYEQSENSKKYGTTKQNLRVVRIKRPGRDKKGARIDTGNAFWQVWYNLGSRHQPARAWIANKFRAVSQRVVDAFGLAVGKAIDELWDQR